MKKYYFKAEKLRVGYGKQPLIENIEICLEKGEILTLIGPNGAGKSTILKSITKQLALLGGTVYLGEQDIGQMSGNELSQNMAVVLTEKLRTEMMTCEEVVATGRYPYTGKFGILSDTDRQAVAEAMELVHVTTLKNKDFSKISDGQRQRVMLARAICQEPEIIILDEPTSYLDIKYKLDFLSILQEMRKKKELTVVMSLHELELAAKVSDKILCVNGSCVERFGTPQEIFKEGYIEKLFSIETGSFDERSESMELESVKGKPEVFVIAGNGSGRNTYRRLQREGIPFATGILFQNDLDYPVAKALAAKVIGTAAFEPITETALTEAKQCINACERVICCREHFGTLEHENQALFDYAKSCKKQIETGR